MCAELFADAPSPIILLATAVPVAVSFGRKPTTVKTKGPVLNNEKIIDARVLTATAVLFLPPAAHACPTGWTPSPASATCFRVPPERSPSFFRCVDLCKEHGGIPACIGSAEENAIAMELAASTTDGMWLGLYQNETGLGSDRGWGRCAAGDAPSVSHWHESQPDD